jgi:tRNA(adenine34) deaminase
MCYINYQNTTFNSLSMNTLTPFSDEYFMKQALRQAHLALDHDEVPVGAVVVCGNQVIARAYNMTETLSDPTAHAEMQAFTAASSFLGGKYLDECTLYVTLEPCAMCAGASFWVQIGRIVYGASDQKRGVSKISSSILHPKTQVLGGVLEHECSMIIKDFFASKRNKNTLSSFTGID